MLGTESHSFFHDWLIRASLVWAQCRWLQLLIANGHNVWNESREQHFTTLCLRFSYILLASFPNFPEPWNRYTFPPYSCTQIVAYSLHLGQHSVTELCPVLHILYCICVIHVPMCVHVQRAQPWLSFFMKTSIFFETSSIRTTSSLCCFVPVLHKSSCVCLPALGIWHVLSYLAFILRFWGWKWNFVLARQVFSLLNALWSLPRLT